MPHRNTSGVYNWRLCTDFRTKSNKAAFLTQLDGKQFERFRHVEDLPTYPEARCSPKELESVHHYDTTSFAQDGRPIVLLPSDKTTTSIDPSNQEILPDIILEWLCVNFFNVTKVPTNDSARQQYVEFFQERIG